MQSITTLSHFRNFVFFVVLLGTSFVISSSGQSANDGFNPSLIPSSEGAPANAVAVQQDGKVLIGGGFNGAQGQPRKALVRVFPNGTLDTQFNANLGGIGTNSFAVTSIVLEPPDQTGAQKILIGGSFTTVDGAPQNYLARLNPNGIRDNTFNPSVSGQVSAMAIQPQDNKIVVVSGLLTSVVSRFNANGMVDPSFNAPIPNGLVNTLAIQRDGKILIGGYFTSLGLTQRNCIARLKTDGTLDAFDPTVDGGVTSIALRVSGGEEKIYIGGVFFNVGGESRPRLARLGSNGERDDSFNANWTDVLPINVASLKVQPDGAVVAGGSFASVGGVPRNCMARFSRVGVLDANFNPNVTLSAQGASSPTVNAIAIQDDRRILLVGDFLNVRGEVRVDAARLEPDGRLDRTLDPNVVGSAVYATAVQGDAKILLGGSFTSVAGDTRQNLARLNSDGTLDTDFNPPYIDGFVLAIAVQEASDPQDRKILIGGYFTIIDGLDPYHNIARLNEDGSLDTSFRPNPNGTVSAIAIQTDKKILVGGNFSALAGASNIGHLARLETSGTRDSNFNPNVTGFDPSTTVLSIAIQSAPAAQPEKIIVGGIFANAGGQARNNIARLDTATGAADAFDPNADGWVGAIAVLPRDKIMIAGDFNSLQPNGGTGVPFKKLARLNLNGTVDGTFDTPSIDGAIYSIAAEAGGKIIAGGTFNNVGSQARSRLARFTSIGPVDTFNPSPNQDVNTVAFHGGKILVGGSFTVIDGVTRNLFARLSPNSPTRRTLTVCQNGVGFGITGGTYYAYLGEAYSTNNGATWSAVVPVFAGGPPPGCTNQPIGSAKGQLQSAPLADDEVYSADGLNLPTGQDILIRIQAFSNDGGAPEEFVWDAFIQAPTAAMVSISGRVMTSDGRGLRNAVVTLTNAAGDTRTARTSTFGFYRFDEIGAGQTVIVGVRSKLYQFSPQVINLNDNVSGVDFTAAGDDFK